jgi:hypothetical protein
VTLKGSILRASAWDSGTRGRHTQQQAWLCRWRKADTRCPCPGCLLWARSVIPDCFCSVPDLLSCLEGCWGTHCSPFTHFSPRWRPRPSRRRQGSYMDCPCQSAPIKRHAPRPGRSRVRGACRLSGPVELAFAGEERIDQGFDIASLSINDKTRNQSHLNFCCL